MNYYLPPELYREVKFSLLLVDKKCDTYPYFETMNHAIMTSTPLVSNYVDDFRGKRMYVYKSNVNKPFFDAIVRKPMSSEMRKKIGEKYPSDVAQKIFRYCGTTKTLRFTADIAKAKDILTVIV